MSENGQLPTSSDAQNIGARADKCFIARCPETWRPKSVEGTDDFGIDYQVQTLVNSQANDMFRVQLKGTTIPTLNAERTHFSIQLKASTIRYYNRFTESILLVLCDLSAAAKAVDCHLYYVWIHDELRRLNARDLPAEQLYVNLHVPTVNELHEETDLSADLAQFKALADIGMALDATLEERAPSIDGKTRSTMLERIPTGISARGLSLMESLAADPATVWPERPKNSMAWLLHEADQHLNCGAFDKAEEMLAAASRLLEDAVSLERADYWHIKGRLLLLRLEQDEACQAFAKAMETEPDIPKYAAAWAETRMVIDFNFDTPNDFADVYAALASSAPAILAVKARLLAAERRYEEADDILELFSGSEQLSTKAIIYTMRADAPNALEACEQGLALHGLKDSTRLLFTTLKARAQFNLALDIAPSAGSAHARIPLTGKPGMDLAMLRDAWDGMKTVMKGLRATGWPANIEFVADMLHATASILDKEGEALAMLAEAAEQRPTLPGLQAAVEALAAFTGDVELALKANERQKRTPITTLRKIFLFHTAKRDAECVDMFEAGLPSFDQKSPVFAETLPVAIASADRLIRSDLTKAWLELLDSMPELAPQRALWDFYSTATKNPAKRSQALDALLASFETLAKPMAIAVPLFHALRPTILEEAEKMIPVAEVMARDQLLELGGTLHLAQALTTLERWEELLAVLDEAQERYREDKTLISVRALALDRLGRTAEARALLLPFVEQGVTDHFLLYTHIDIATRCGFIDEAIRAVERLVSSTVEPAKKIQHLRILHSLIHAHLPSNSRAHDIAWRIGELTDQNDMLAEGSFLGMVMTSSAQRKDEDHKGPELRERLSAYNAKFPDSPILRAAAFPEDATPEEMLDTIMRLAGDTPETLQARRERADLFTKEERAVPYAWRPRTFIPEARDLPQLWEMTKEAKGTEQRLLLGMASGEWSAMSWDSMIERIPLMDLTALLVAQDLGLLDMLFDLFPQIAVSQETMMELGRLVDPLSGSLARQKCLSLQKALQDKLDRLLQPRASSAEVLSERSNKLRMAEELKALSRQRPYLLYSDDFYFRFFCSYHSESRQKDDAFQSVCALDILTALEKQGKLSPAEVADKIGQLCEWGVGLVIDLKWQLASLPAALNEVQHIDAGVEMIKDSPRRMAIFNGMWDRPTATYRELKNDAGYLLRMMLDDDTRSTTSIASLLAIWLPKCMTQPDAPPDRLTTIQVLARQALVIKDEVGASFSARLWEVYFLLAAHEQAKPLDADGLFDAIANIACMAATSDLCAHSLARKSLQTMLELGLGERSAELRFFRTAYRLWRNEIARRMGAPAPTFTYQESLSEGPSYHQRWRAYSLPSDYVNSAHLARRSCA